MSYGHLSPAQSEALTPHVQGRVVHDFGAGSCELARKLVQLGAEQVIAIDKEKMPCVDDPRVIQKHGYFGQAAADEIDVAFMSWPQNMESPVLLALVEHARTVVYLGKNTDGSSCGWPGLFESLLWRRLLVYTPERPNTLIIYGGKLKRRRRPRGEERAAITIEEQVRPLKYETVEADDKE